MLIKKERIPITKILVLGFLPSYLKVLFYRLKGYKIGKKVKIGFGSVIIGKNVNIQESVRIGYFTIVRANKIKIGRFVFIGSLTYIETENLVIGEDTRIRENVNVGGISFPDSSLTIGKRSIVLKNTVLNPTRPIIIGDDSGIGGNCQIFTHGSWLSQLDGYPVSFSPVVIGNNVWIAWNVFILPGVTIGDNVIISASSLVNKNIPSNCIAAGNPAKVVVKRFPFIPLTEEQQEIKINYIKEFCSYLEHNNIKCEYINSENKLNIKFENGRKNHQLIYQKSIGQIRFSSKDNVLIIDENTSSTKGNEQINTKMLISFRDKSRIGSSEIGEEFVRFISRYGLRFKRID